MKGTLRVTQAFASNNLVNEVLKNRAEVNRYSEEVSTGLKVRAPGESSQAGTISQFQEMITRINGYNQRITTSTSMLTFQDDVLTQANDLIARAKEVATQASNETNSAETRKQMAAEIFQLRDQMVSLANSTYQGRYIFGGADDGDAPFDLATTSPYTAPTTGAASQHYAFDNGTGSAVQRTTQVTDDLNLTITTSGDSIFTKALNGLERLGRSLDGYQTIVDTTTGAPVTGPGSNTSAFVFPDQFTKQSAEIKESLDFLETARTTDIMPERVSIGARLKRLETAEGMLTLNKTSAQKVIDDLQNADVVESASKLSYAQTAFEASLQVTLRALNLSILNYL